MQVKLFDDVRAHANRGRGGQRHERHVRENPAQRRNLPVLRAKIMPPFADAMRLINCERRDVPLLQVIEKAGHEQPLRRDVEQFEFAVVQPAQTTARFTCAKR